MQYIRDRDGNVIRRSHSSRGIREYIGSTHSLISMLSINRIGTYEGKLMILFEDGVSYEENWISFDTLKDALRRWRNVWGAPLMIDGVRKGMVGKNNPALASHNN